MTANTMSSTGLVVANPDVIFQELEGELVLLNLSNEQYFGLDPIGKRIWELLQQSNSLEVCVSAICAAYDVDEIVAKKDIEKLKQQLLAADLVRAPKTTL